MFVHACVCLWHAISTLIEISLKATANYKMPITSNLKKYKKCWNYSKSDYAPVKLTLCGLIKVTPLERKYAQCVQLARTSKQTSAVGILNAS